MVDVSSMQQAKQVLGLTNQAIGASQQLRTTVTQAFEFLRDGMSGEDGSTQNCRNHFLQKFQELLQAINKDLTDLEKLSNLMTTMPDLLQNPLGPAGQLSLEGNTDDNSLFQNTLLTYQWYSRLHSRAQIGHNILNSSSYRRSLSSSATSLTRSNGGLGPAVGPVKTPNLTPQQADNFLTGIASRQFADLAVEVRASFGTTRIVHVKVQKVFHAWILMKNLVIEKIIIRGLDEEGKCIGGSSQDMTTESRYECMRLITDHATTALLYIDQYLQVQFDLKMRFILSWMQNYTSLFTDSCHKCGKIISNGLPPTWRDFKTHAPFHVTCK